MYNVDSMFLLLVKTQRFLYDVDRSYNVEGGTGRSFQIQVLYVVLLVGRDLNCE